MLDPSTFEYLSPSQAQTNRMQQVRVAAAEFARVLDHLIPEGPDKTYLLRHLREVAMWANVAITRETSGSPRRDE